MLCFHPVSSVLSQVSRSPAFLHHTAHGLFLLHSLLAPLAELRGDRCRCARGMVSRFAAEGTLLAASHPCLLLTVSPLRVHGPTEKWENGQIKCRCVAEVSEIWVLAGGQPHNTARLALQNHGTTRRRVGSQDRIKQQCLL